MNPRQLAEETLRPTMPHFTGHVRGEGTVFDSKDALIREMADALIAQADLLEKYRAQHLTDFARPCNFSPPYPESSRRDRRCDLCRAYDAMMKD